MFVLLIESLRNFNFSEKEISNCQKIRKKRNIFCIALGCGEFWWGSGSFVHKFILHCNISIILYWYEIFEDKIQYHYVDPEEKLYFKYMYMLLWIILFKSLCFLITCNSTCTYTVKWFFLRGDNLFYWIRSLPPNFSCQICTCIRKCKTILEEILARVKFCILS